jgi:hypothetical protein
MSFREKTGISFISMFVIYASYFWSAFHQRSRGPGPQVAGLVGTIIALLIVHVVLNVAVAIIDPRDAKAPRDEREKLIDLRATQLGYAALAGSVACACIFGAFNAPIIFNTNALLFLLVIAEILRSGCQIIQYRRTG